MSIQPIQTAPSAANASLAPAPAASPASAAALAADQIVMSGKQGSAARGDTGGGDSTDQDRAVLVMPGRGRGIGSATPASIVNAQIASIGPDDIFAKLALPNPLPTAPILENRAAAAG